MSDNKKIFDSLKDAGSAAFDVVKDFGGRLQEERAQYAHGAEANSPYGASDKDGLVDKATTTAKELGASLKKAADGTRESAAFDAAKGKFSTAYNETREGVMDAYNSAQARRAEKKNAARPGQDSAPSQGDNIIDGEVIETDDPQN
ncbi:CGLAU_01105 family protein [Corynebacterium yonathiae]|uniref:CGLAU_01105 family protein n=1 Tax=Corynebacterium yonathiae TaxID=2913504 RepID=A0A9X3LZU9_9CORY|nr:MULTISPECIES: CGLAU_01105 family protein [Corynebacterium]MCZ9295783.1 CGLAU_01105 family protein [Corynebacterium yonathiae]MDK2582387.1 CGLAU_01105 family protein [Corynebacterium sp. BWA136]